MDKLFAHLIALALILLGLGLMAAFFALPLMWLWNYLFCGTVTMALFGIPKLTFLKALALSFLASLIFKTSTKSK